MKKTIPTTLSGILFYIEEDAFARLSSYLDSVKSYFASYENSGEIISDIENRISEQFLENSSDKIVTLKTVEALIASMGNVEDFNDMESGNNTSNSETTTNTASKKNKKLFRNPDDLVIAGVASGLGAYFGIDPIIIRLIFVAIVFAGGSGVMIYIILWFVMPMAQTSSEKLQMRGEAVTLGSVSEIVKEKVNEVKNRGTFRKIIGFPFLVIGTVLRFILPVIQKIIGFVISFSTSIAMIAIVFTLTMTLFNLNSPYVDFPLLELGHTALIYVLLFAGFFVIFIPLLFIFSLGVKLLSRKNMWNGRGLVGFISLTGLWFFALMSLGAAASRIIPEYQHFMETNPQYQDVSKEFSLSDFDKISVRNNSEVTITEGDEFKVIAVGWPKSVDNATLEVVDGELRIGRTNPFKICIFCMNRTPEIQVTMPTLSELTASNSSEVNSNSITGETLKINLSNSSSAKLLLSIKNLEINQGNSSWVYLSGTTTSAKISLANSSDLRAFDLSIENAVITAENTSDAELFVTKTLDASLKNSSNVTYKGNPTIIKKISNSSDLRQENEEEVKDSWEY